MSAKNISRCCCLMSSDSNMSGPLPGLKKVISGGQTGVDRAALDAAIYRGYTWGGWVPKGRLAEDGEIPEIYFNPDRIGCGLQESKVSRDYKSRTVKNIDEADATMILRLHGGGRVLGPGTKLTIRTLQRRMKPYRLFDPSRVGSVPRAVRWIVETTFEDRGRILNIETLNVSGSRESSNPGIYKLSKQYLTDVFGYVYAYQRWGVKIWAPKQNQHVRSKGKE